MFTLVLVVIMMLAMSVTALAQEQDSGKGGVASITINNAAKGETYNVVKMFDATYNTTTGAIAYVGEIPTDLTSYFEKNADNQIVVKDGVDLTSSTVVAALKSWATEQTPAATAVSDGSVLKFTGLQYGYYLVTTAVGSVVSLDSTTPNATIYDKNPTAPVGEDFSKTVTSGKVAVGETITYTVTFSTSNFDGTGKAAQRIIWYKVQDVTPHFLDNVTVTKVTITEGESGSEYRTDKGEVPQFVEDADPNCSFTIPWVDGDGNSKYKNGAVVTITYTAEVNGEAVELAAAGKKLTNTVNVTWNTNTTGSTTTEEINVYYFSLQKTDDSYTPSKVLDGAKFKLYSDESCTQEVSLMKVTGEETYYRPATTKEKAATGFEAATIEAGRVNIKGLAANTIYYLKETEAPKGYNLLSNATPVEMGSADKTASTVTYENEEGEMVEVNYNAGVVVINNTGTELPSTGGIGTTIFYVIGAILVVGAGVILITRKRMTDAK